MASDIFPLVKEIHYFDHIHLGSGHLQRWRKRYAEMLAEGGRWPVAVERDRLERLLNSGVDDEWYRELLHNRDGWALDITPLYARVGVEGFSHMKSIARRVKLIYILRDPVERAWSGMHQKYGKNIGMSMEMFESRLDDIESLERECTTDPDIAAKSDYADTLSSIREAGMEDDLLVLYHDGISADPDGFIDTIYRFIGIENGIAGTHEYRDTIGRKIYESQKKLDMPPLLEERLVSHYAGSLSLLEEKYGLELPERWRKRYGI
jgi:hypothetical protein